jgi:proteasome alpha subunit
VVGISANEGVFLLTVRRSQRKIYEIYDRQMFSAIGMQGDIEEVRVGTIQAAHQEGYERSPDDITLQRLVGFNLSRQLKRAYGDLWSSVPFVIRALFAELGRTPEKDVFYALNYDGEFRVSHGAAVIAGSQLAEDRMLEKIGDPDPKWTRKEALQRALAAWSAGAREALRRHGALTEESEDSGMLRDVEEGDADRVFLRDELKTGEIEVGLLERNTHRESRFRLLSGADVAFLLEGVL